MALRYCDGFDYYTSLVLNWDYVPNFIEINTVTPRTGTSSLQFTYGGGTGLGKLFDAQQTWIIGFAFRPFAAMSGIIAAIVDSSTTQVDLRIDTNGAIIVTRNGTTLSTSANGVITIGVWQFVEFKVVISDSGSYEVRVLGVNVTSGSAIDTQATANATADKIYFNSCGVWDSARFDDIYICDGTGTTNNNFLGDCKVVALFPNTNGTTQQWTPSTGVDHYSVIDEVDPNSDTDYLYAGDINYTDTNAFQDLSSTGTIYGAKVSSYVRKDDAGSKTFAPVVRSGGANYVGSEVLLPDSYIYARQIYETDPATAAAWTVDGINAIECGGKVIL